MIVLRANPELKQTFEKLIQTMKVPVKWNGRFVVIDNCLILQGEVRSLFFHFDSRKVLTNLIELPIREEEIQDAAGKVQVQNVINMILYVFGKWGTIKGLKVEKNYVQLNQLFNGIMREIRVEPEYTNEHFRFYKDGIRITYEDVICAAIEAAEEVVQEEEAAEETGGLWHKLIWKKDRADFSRVETTLTERLKGRLGNNFYIVGYLCPVCGEKLHMVVYPMDQELKIETEEGAVLLARACACDRCNSFYTPRPRKLLAEGDVYTMQFGDDRKAYEDYLELLGRTGERISNYRCNEFADKRAENPEKPEESLEEVCENLEDYSEEELGQIVERIEEGFYPDMSIQKYEKRVRERRERVKAERGGADRNKEREERAYGKKPRAGIAGNPGCGRNSISGGEMGAGGKKAPNAGIDEAGAGRSDRTEHGADKSNGGLGSGCSDRTEYGASGSNGGSEAGGYGRAGGGEPDAAASPEEQESIRKKYEAKLAVRDRFSERQLRELKGQLERETKLAPEHRERYLREVEETYHRLRGKQLEQKVDGCEGKNYGLLKKVLKELEQEELPDEIREPLLEKLRRFKREQADREVAQLTAKMSNHMDRGAYRRFMERIREYEEADLSPYEEKFKSSREAAEREELSKLVRRARKNTREDYAGLAQKLRDGDFLPELVLPYVEKIEDKIRQIDEEALAELCGDPAHMSFEEGIEAYEKVEQGEFLPELKDNTLKMLQKRLSKIKTDECELLVKKLEEELGEAGIVENKRHHFYPARRVLLGQAEQEETEVIDFAVASYAAGRGPFEYPVMVVDTSRNESGKEGIILTPDHLYYSTMLTAYGIQVPMIDRITASTGFLNRGLYAHQKNGTKTKLPYAVENRELAAFAEVLNGFIHYLQEKPDSRNVNYLAKERHDTICCFRCGYVYQGGAVCPKCGFKNNE